MMRWTRIFPARSDAPSPLMQWLFSALIVAAAALFLVVPYWYLVEMGPLHWHVEQATAIEGAIEACVLLAFLAIGMGCARRFGLIACVVLVAVPAVFYARRHAFDVSMLIDILYIEIIVGLGALARRFSGLQPPHTAIDYVQSFIAGLLIWSVFAWTTSALDFGSIKALRWLTLLLGVPAVFGGHRPLMLWLWQRMRAQSWGARAWCGLLGGWFLILFARSKVVFGYDPLWYGLRPEYVLLPHDSIYEGLGLVSPVHYYPKLYEMFLMPVSALRDSSVIDGVTIAMLGLILLVCHRMMQALAMPVRAQWPTLALVASLPALANSVVGPKPDVIATLFVLVSALFAFGSLRATRTERLCWIVTGGLLACLVKLAAIPYAGVAVLAGGIAVIRLPRDPENGVRKIAANRFAIAVLLLGVVVAIFVTARTWLLAGVPTSGPDQLYALWTLLGMHLREPAGSLGWAAAPQQWSDLPVLAYDWLFRPQKLGHIVITWVGNVWFWCALFAIAATVMWRIPRRSSRLPLPITALILTGAVLAFGVQYAVRGSDGNYFLYALVPGIVVASAWLFRRLRGAPGATVVALACLPAFAFFQAACSFLTTGWAPPGTRIFDIVLDRDWQTMNETRRHHLQYAGLDNIGHYLQAAGDPARVVGYCDDDLSLWLPARFEYLPTIAISRPEYLASAEEFLAFMRDQGIDYLILPRPAAIPALTPRMGVMAPGVLAAARILKADPRTRRIEDEKYYLLDFSAMHASQATTRMP